MCIENILPEETYKLNQFHKYVEVKKLFKKIHATTEIQRYTIYYFSKYKSKFQKY